MSIKRGLPPSLNTQLMKFFLFKADNQEDFTDLIESMSPYLRSEVLFMQVSNFSHDRFQALPPKARIKVRGMYDARGGCVPLADFQPRPLFDLFLN
jgi:hypothetical protein